MILASTPDMIRAGRHGKIPCCVSSRSFGVKRTFLFAVRMSAFDPKRTWSRPSRRLFMFFSWLPLGAESLVGSPGGGSSNNCYQMV